MVFISRSNDCLRRINQELRKRDCSPRVLRGSKLWECLSLSRSPLYPLIKRLTYLEPVTYDMEWAHPGCGCGGEANGMSPYGALTTANLCPPSPSTNQPTKPNFLLSFFLSCTASKQATFPSRQTVECVNSHFFQSL